MLSAGTFRFNRGKIPVPVVCRGCSDVFGLNIYLTVCSQVCPVAEPEAMTQGSHRPTPIDLLVKPLCTARVIKVSHAIY